MQNFTQDELLALVREYHVSVGNLGRIMARFNDTELRDANYFAVYAMAQVPGLSEFRDKLLCALGAAVAAEAKQRDISEREYHSSRKVSDVL
jgi:hypothetical protein